jgi:hypothetical protein
MALTAGKAKKEQNHLLFSQRILMTSDSFNLIENGMLEKHEEYFGLEILTKG